MFDITLWGQTQEKSNSNIYSMILVKADVSIRLKELKI